MIIICVAVILLVLIILNFRSVKCIERNKKVYLTWLDQRIADLQKEYDDIVAYDNDPMFQVKLTKGGKLKAYKELRDYINSH